MFYIIWFGIWIVVLFFALRRIAKDKELSEGNVSESFIAGNDFGSIRKGDVLLGVLKENCIYFYNKSDSEINTSLPYNKITGLRITSDTEIIEKSKSVGGRAVLGGLILGPVGAIVGGMSGIGNKTKQEVSNYILINYKSGDDVSAILLKEVPATNWTKWMKEVETRSGCIPQKSVEL